MIQFDWRKVPPNLLERFDQVEEARGQEQWRWLVKRVLPLIGRPDPMGLEHYGQLHSLLEQYIGRLDSLPQPAPAPMCCVFVSHKSLDVKLADWIARIAVERGFDYWLDVEDPGLKAVTGAPIASPYQEILIAALVEIALLNSTHLIAVHTARSHTSMWVPYEIGRAKSRRILSSQVSGWFQPGKVTLKAGEYTYLMPRLRYRRDITQWLAWQHVNQPGTCWLPGKVATKNRIGWPR